MSTDNLQLTLNAKTSFEFELSVKGIDLKQATVRFGLEKSGVTLQFPCKRNKNDKWNVVVPPLDTFGLKEGLYAHTIELMSNGYYFTPVKGTAEVAPAAEVTGSLVKKEVKVAVSGMKVTENVVVKKEPIIKRQAPKPKPKLKSTTLKENKTTPSADMHLARLRRLAGIK